MKDASNDCIDKAAAWEQKIRGVHIDYGTMEPVLHEVIQSFSPENTLVTCYPLRWLAIKLMEADSIERLCVSRGCATPCGACSFLCHDEYETDDRGDALTAKLSVALF